MVKHPICTVHKKQHYNAFCSRVPYCETAYGAFCSIQIWSQFQYFQDEQGDSPWTGDKYLLSSLCHSYSILPPQSSSLLPKKDVVCSTSLAKTWSRIIFARCANWFLMIRGRCWQIYKASVSMERAEGNVGQSCLDYGSLQRQWWWSTKIQSLKQLRLDPWS